MGPSVVEENLESDVLRQAFTAGLLDRYESLEFSYALGWIWQHVRGLNQRIAVVAPWELAKQPNRKEELHAFLYRLLDAVRLVAVLASPVIPRASGRIFRMLGLGDHDPTPKDLEWGRLEPGTPLGTIEPLFPRVETDRDHGKKSESSKKEKIVTETTPPVPAALSAAGPGPASDKIDIAEFAKVELRAAVIKEAEKIAGSKRLVKLQVDLGTETRQVVAGIAESYAPEALVGKRIVLVANLKPAKLMGVESNGMVLAGSVDGQAVLCTFDRDVAPGTKVK
jgi:methionyl-tRNA synthetase